MKDKVNIKRVENEIIDGYPTGNVYVGLTLEEYHQLEEDLDKLEQYKNIEEKLGINLIILFKALKEGYFFKKDTGEIVSVQDSFFNYYRHNLYYCIEGWYIYSKNGYSRFDVRLKDYGKTWALTKEELE